MVQISHELATIHSFLEIGLGVWSIFDTRFAINLAKIAKQQISINLLKKTSLSQTLLYFLFIQIITTNFDQFIYFKKDIISIGSTEKNFKN